MTLWVAMTSALISAVVCGVLARWGPRDHPVARSSHLRPTATAGGLALLAGLAGVAVLWPAQVPGPVLAAVAAAAAVGLWDDLRPLPPKRKLLVQALLVMGCMVLVPPQVVWPLAALWALAVVNAVNFMDGADGMAGGLLAVVLLAIAPHWPAAIPLLAAVAVFLIFNLRKRLFLGDCGAHVVAVVLIIAACAGHAWVVMAALVPFAVDTAGTLLLRLARREPFWQAHRQHLYQRLMQRGMPHVVVSGIYTALAGAGVVAVTVAPDPLRLWVLGGWAVVVLMAWGYARRAAQ